MPSTLSYCELPGSTLKPSKFDLAPKLVLVMKCECILVTLAGTCICLIDVPANGPEPIVVTVSGIVISLRLEADINALVPMLVSPDGKTTLVKLVALEKALARIAVTVSGMT